MPFVKNADGASFWRDDPADYLQNGTVDYPGGSSPVNPRQFATQATADQLAQQYGGTASTINLEGPGYGWSPQQQLNIPGAPSQLNAGLVADTLGRYPGAYGQYEVARDINPNIPNPYATNRGNLSELDRQAQSYGWNDAVRARQGLPPIAETNRLLSSGSGSNVLNAQGQWVTPSSARTTAPPPASSGATQRSTAPPPGTTGGRTTAPPPATTPTRPNPTSTIQRPTPATPGAPVVPPRTSIQNLQTSNVVRNQRNPLGDPASWLGGIQPAGETDAPTQQGGAATNGAPAPGTIYQGAGGTQQRWTGSGWEAVDQGSALGGVGAVPTGESIGSGGANTGGSGDSYYGAGDAPTGYSGEEYDASGGGIPDPRQMQSAYQPPNAGFVPTNTAVSPRATSPYGAGAYVNPMYTQRDTPEGQNSGEGLQYKSENDRAMAIAQGLGLQQDLGNYTNYQQGRADDYEAAGDAAYSGIANGGGGYSDSERSAIQNQEGLDRLQLSPDDAQSNYLTDQEQGDLHWTQNDAGEWSQEGTPGIRGDPYAAYRQLGLDEQSIDASTNSRNANVRGALDRQDAGIDQGLTEGASAIRNAMYSNRERQWQNLSDTAALTRGQQSNAESNVRGALNYGEDTARDQQNQATSNVRGALNYGEDTTRQQQSNAESNVRGALDSGEDSARSYIDPSRLGLSDEYNRNYNVGERDVQNIRDRAGRAVGAQTAMDEQRLLMDANAQGNTSPLAIQSARARMRQQGAVASANAISDADIAGRRLALDTAQGRENTRLGAETNIANLGTGTELALGGRRSAAEQTLGTQGLTNEQQLGARRTAAEQGLGAQGVQNEQTLGARRTTAEQSLGSQGLQNEQQLGASTLSTQNTLGAAEQGAEQYLANQRQQAEQFRGGSRVGAEQALGAAGTQAEEFKTETNLGAGERADATASNRAQQIATNRQTTNASNQAQQFQRGQYIYGAGNANQTNFANQRRADENEYRGYLTGQGTQANQSAQVGNQQRIGAYGTQTGAQNAATGNAITNYRVPDQSSAGSILGHLGLAKGGVMKGPQQALVGEAGPELIISFGGPHYGAGTDGVVMPDYGQYDPYESTTMTGPQAPRGQIAQTATMNSRNPIYENILQGMRNTQPPQGGYPQDPVAGVGSGGLGKQLTSSLISAGLKALFPAAQGAIVAPQREQVAPGVSYVNGPQVATLGQYGADAVIPLNRRPGNKTNVEDIPELARRYGSYGA